MSLSFESYLDAIGEESERLLDAASEANGVVVPTCPGWRMPDLIRHVTDVYRHWTAQVLAGDPEHHIDVVEVIGGTDDADATALAEACDYLVDALSASGPGAPAWNWSGEDLDVAWVARRMALETAVHRVDAELARSKQNPIERELAVDGINERIEVHLQLDIREAPDASLGGSICLVCLDDPAAWVVEVDRGRLRWRHGRGPADTAIVGTASDLFLFTWNRRPPEDFSITGDLRVASAWQGLPT